MRFGVLAVIRERRACSVVIRGINDGGGIRETTMHACFLGRWFARRSNEKKLLLYSRSQGPLIHENARGIVDSSNCRPSLAPILDLRFPSCSTYSPPFSNAHKPSSGQDGATISITRRI